jgi:hypothetical protein
MARDLPPVPKNAVRLKCAYFSEVVVAYYSVDELESAPEQAGWYCWVFVPTTPDEVCPEVARPSAVTATIDSVLGVQYKGDALVVPLERPELGSNDFVRLRNAMLAFGAPLYIGIANNLRSRLLSHRRNLDGAPGPEGESAVESDSERESAYFGRRVGELLAKKQIARRGLFVKCVSEPTASRKSLKAVETILNRMFAPPLGRRS